jgi:hypothetical protein
MRSTQLFIIVLMFGARTITWAADPWAPKIEILPGVPGRAELAGEWFQSRMSTVEFSNPYTGSFSDPSGELTNVRFLPDGTFKLGWLRQSSPGAGFGALQPDAAWPVSLADSVLWPWGVPLGYIACLRVAGTAPRNARLSVMIATEGLWWPLSVPLFGFAGNDARASNLRLANARPHVAL